LEKSGYTHKGEWNVPLKCGFTKRGDVDVNLHVFFDENHPEIELNLLFRDYLREHPDARDEYAATKVRILQDDAAQERVGTLAFPVYTLKKREFIYGILNKVGFDRLRVLKCTADEEWAAAKDFRKKHFFFKLGTADPQSSTLNSPGHEHWLLYKGTEIIGYSHVQLLPKSRVRVHVVMLSDEYRRLNNDSFSSYFFKVIVKWIRFNGAKIVYNAEDSFALL
jgi:hypothetical protein